MNTFVSLGIIGCLSLGALCQAEVMTNTQKKKIIGDLNKILETGMNEETKVLNVAINRLSSAGKDPGAAYDLKVQSRKLLMEQAKKKDRTEGRSAKGSINAYREWMDKEAKNLQNKNAQKGLMLKYQWGALVLKARMMENTLKTTDAGAQLDMTEFRQPAMALLNAYQNACEDPEFAQGLGAKLATTSVLNTDVGKVLGISGMSSEGFPESMNNLDDVFDKLFLNEYRQNRNVKGIREAWNKKIAIKKVTARIPDDYRKDFYTKAEKTENMQSRLNINQSGLTVSQLRMLCELDCFDAGDQVRATNNMLKIIKEVIDPNEKESLAFMLKGKLMNSMQQKKPEAPSTPAPTENNAAPPPEKNVNKETPKPSPVPAPATDNRDEDDSDFFDGM